MPRFFKIIIMIVSAAALLTVWFFLYPSSRKEIKSEEIGILNEYISLEKIDKPIETTPETLADKKSAEQQPEKENTEEKGEDFQLTSEKKPDKGLVIIQHPINWGFSSKSSRSIDTIIIHSSYNVLTNDPYDFKKLLDEYKSYGVAPHYVIDRKGTIYQLTKDNNVAYHAGESKMPDGRTNVNNFSIGIEMMNTDQDKMTESQYDALRKLIGYLKGKYKIKNVLGHNQIAPGRKTDPWNFNWNKI